ncbi:hypothetical protein HRbin02_00665 [Candidatus Calditenuaceae archaeon HR02]|nr:hypothetical protein HRbin02_00665 [Candidatus Calditenuaceae archaeon HR02]
MKLILTFTPGKFTFNCTKCAKCCFPAELSLTAREFNFLSKVADRKERFIFIADIPFSYKLRVKGRCPFLDENKLCKIYKNRPIVCISFPLTFEYLPDGRLFVNFIRCEGVGVGDQIVDMDFVLKTIDEIKQRDPSFFDSLLINKLYKNPFVPFYTHDEYVSYDSKLSFNKFLAKMVKDYSRNQYNPRTYLHSFILTIRQAIETALNMKKHSGDLHRSLIFDEEAEALKDEINSYYSQKFEENFKVIDHYIEEAEDIARKTRVCEIYLDGKVKKLRIDEHVKLSTALNHSDVAEFQVSQIYFRKNFEEEAFNFIVDYISEVLVRVGLGGFPIDAPLYIVLDVLGEYINNIEFQCNLYSGKSNVVTLKEAKRAIEDLDTNFALGSIYNARERTFTF